MSLVVQVQLRKGDRLYINDGVYGSFSEMVTANIRLPAELIRLKRRRQPRRALRAQRPDLRFAGRAAWHVRAAGRRATRAIGSRSTGSAPTFRNATPRFNGFYPETLIVIQDQPMAAGRARRKRSRLV